MSCLPACVPSSLRTVLPSLLTRGACLVFPGPEMPVPIPLNECVFRDETHLLWATGHTPYGPTRPCVGRLEFHGWSRLEENAPGVVLLAATGREVARIVPLDQLPLPAMRARRLREEQARHEQRAATEPGYTRLWAMRFKEASAALSST